MLIRHFYNIKNMAVSQDELEEYVCDIPWGKKDVLEKYGEEYRRNVPMCMAGYKKRKVEFVERRRYEDQGFCISF